MHSNRKASRCNLRGPKFRNFWQHLCRGVGFVSACMSNSATATQLVISELFLSHSTGGLYVQSGDNINSQDNSTETEI